MTSGGAQEERKFVDAYQAIGYFVVQMTQVEFMCSVIAIRLGVDPAKVHAMQASEVVRKINVRAGDSEVGAGASAALRAHSAQRLLRQRNTFVHGRLWQMHQPDGFTMSRIEKDGSTHTLAVPYREFNKIVDRCLALSEALHPFLPDGLRASKFVE
jgi:hypothetical protein